MALKLQSQQARGIKTNFLTIYSIGFIQTRKKAIMTTKAKIKVIKKKELENAQIPAAVEKKSTQETAREMVSVVTDWVADFQQKRREETKQAFEKLFSQHPQTNGV